MTPEYEQYCIDQSEAWLEKCRKLVGYERTLREKAQSHYDMLKGIDYSAVNVQNSPSPDAIPNMVIANQVIIEKLDEIADDAARRIREAEAALASMDNPLEARCLCLYYIDAIGTWERVAEEMGYGHDGMMALRRRALLHVYDVMPCSEREPIYKAY